jgi:hypothetical protein
MYYRNNIKIVEERPTGGKAGRHYNKTSTILIIDVMSNLGYIILKQFRFKINDKISKKKAIEKAEKFRESLFASDEQN